jgi:serine/threonine protein kinase
MEAVETLEHRPIRWCNYRSSPNCIRVDAQRRLDDLRQLKPVHQSGGSCESPCVFSKLIVSNLHQLVDIASGLEYLHSLDVVHGDLKGVSIHNTDLVAFLTRVL